MRTACRAIRDLAAEIIRRATPQHVDGGRAKWQIIPVGDPPSPEEQLLLLAARLQGIPVTVMRRDPMTIEEWIAAHAVTENVS